MSVEALLAGIVGLVAGVLIALWLDSQTLVRRVQAANAEKSKAQAALQKFQIQHQAAEQQLHATKTQMSTTVIDATQYEEIIAKQLAEIEASREQLQTTIRTNESLREKLQGEQDRLEEVEALLLSTQEELATAVSENNRLLGDVQLMEAEIVSLEAKTTQPVSEQTALAELEQKVTVAEEQLATMEAEKDSINSQLQQAELTNVEQNARIESLLRQLEETQALRKQLAAANEKLQTVESHNQTLQDKMDDVQTKVSYSGKNQLQLIRGIGLPMRDV